MQNINSYSIFLLATLKVDVYIHKKRYVYTHVFVQNQYDKNTLIYKNTSCYSTLVGITKREWMFTYLTIFLMYVNIHS